MPIVPRSSKDEISVWVLGVIRLHHLPWGQSEKMTQRWLVLFTAEVPSDEYMETKLSNIVEPTIDVRTNWLARVSEAAHALPPTSKSSWEVTLVDLVFPSERLFQSIASHWYLIGTVG